MDDVRIYNRALSAAEIQTLAGAQTVATTATPDAPRREPTRNAPDDEETKRLKQYLAAYLQQLGKGQRAQGKQTLESALELATEKKEAAMVTRLDATSTVFPTGVTRWVSGSGRRPSDAAMSWMRS